MNCAQLTSKLWAKRGGMILMLCCGFLFFSFRCAAQEKTDSIPWFYDDGGISSAKNILKLDLTGILQGEYAVCWERMYYKNLCVQLSAGILSPRFSYKFLLDDLFCPWYNNFFPEKTGWSLGIENKLYPKGPPKGFYILCGAKHRQFSEVVTNDLYTGIGWQLKITDYIPLEMNLGLGVRYQRSRDGASYVFDNNQDQVTILPFTARIGYLF